MKKLCPRLVSKLTFFEREKITKLRVRKNGKFGNNRDVIHAPDGKSEKSSARKKTRTEINTTARVRDSEDPWLFERQIFCRQTSAGARE